MVARALRYKGEPGQARFQEVDMTSQIHPQLSHCGVYARDIDPLGFKTIEMSMLVTNEVVEKTREILYNRALREEWAAINFDLGVKFFSYSVARRKLAGRIARLFGEA